MILKQTFAALVIFLSAHGCNLTFPLTLEGDVRNSQVSGCVDVEPLSRVLFKKKSGWTTPSLNNRSIQNERVFEVDGVTVKTITFDVHRPKDPEFLQIDLCNPLPDGGFDNVPGDFAVYNLEVTSTEGKPFSVLLETLPWEIRPFYALESFRYIDDDGDGVYEILERGFKYPVRLPTWLKAGK